VLERAGGAPETKRTTTVTLEPQRFGRRVREIHAFDEQRVAIAGERGFFAYSTDGGKTWTEKPAFPADVQDLKGGQWPHLWAVVGTEWSLGPQTGARLLYSSLPAERWQAIDTPAPVEDVVPLHGNEAIVATSQGLFRVPGSGWPRIDVPDIVPERVGASGDGKVIVVCGAPRQRTGEGDAARCVWARDVDRSKPAAFTELMRTRFDDPEPWVAADGRLALVADAELYRLEPAAGVWTSIPRAAQTFSRAPFDVMPWSLEGAGTKGILFARSDDGADWRLVTIPLARPVRSAHASSLVRDGSTQGAWAHINGVLLRSTEDRPWVLGWKEQGPIGAYRVARNPHGEITIHSERQLSKRSTDSALSIWSPDGSGEHGSFRTVEEPDGYTAVSRSKSDFEIAVRNGNLSMKRPGAPDWTDVAGATGIQSTYCRKDSDDCWAIGDGFAVWHTTRGGPWSRQTTPARGAKLSSVVSRDAHMLVLSESGYFLESRDAGRTWKEHMAGDGALEAAAITRHGVVLLGGEGGRLFRHSSQKGIEEIELFTSSTILAIEEAADGTVFLATAKRAIYRSTDGAATWSELAPPQRRSASGVSAAIEIGGPEPAVWFVRDDRDQQTENSLERVRLLPRTTTLPRPLELALTFRLLNRATLSVTFAEKPNAELELLLTSAGKRLAPIACRAQGSPSGDVCGVTVSGKRMELALDLSAARLTGTEEIAGLDVAFEKYCERFVAAKPLSLGSDLIRENRTSFLVCAVTAALLCALALLYWVSPLSLHWLYSRLSALEGVSGLHKLATLPVKVVTTALSYLVERPRVLDAWIAEVADQFPFERLAGRDVAKPTEQRWRYEPLPVTALEVTHRFTNPSKARFLFELSPKTKGRLVSIRGEGGVGKTMLLDEILSWVGSDLLGHRALVLVDDAGGERLFGHDDVLSRIQARLAARLDPTRKETLPFIRALLRTGRIVLAVDRVSELDEDTKRRLRTLQATVTVRHLLVTTRATLAIEGMELLELEPAPLAAEDLKSYIGSMFPGNKFSSTARAGEVTQKAAEFLSAALRDDQARVPALVVRLFVEELTVRDFDATLVPQSVAALFLSYAERYAAKSAGRHAGAAVLDALRKLAKISVSNDGRIEKVPQMAARQLFPEDGEDGSPFRQLLDAGVLVAAQPVGPVRFALDPVAEYLAMDQLALETKSRNGYSVEQWQLAAHELSSTSLRSVFQRVVEARWQLHSFPKPETIF
jgi:photosystem II stability/assembly factor-like uncharacterized protein